MIDILHMVIVDLSEIANALPIKFFSNSLPNGVIWSYVLVHVENIEDLNKWSFFQKSNS